MRDEHRLGCAVIGTGVMGASHARVWAEMPLTRLVGVYDLDPERTARVAADLNCHAFASLHEAVSRADVSVVSVCTPDCLHVEPTLAAIKAGKHVLVEKPLATTTADADALIEAAGAAGIKLMVGHILRFDPHYAVAQARAREGAIGDLIYAFARRYNVLASGRRIVPHSTVINFLGIHDLDAIQWISGVPIARVFATGSSKLLADRGARDVIVSLLDFANGACGCLEALWVNPEGVVSTLDARLELVGTEGRLDVRVAHDGVLLSSPEATSSWDVTYSPEVQGRLAGALRTQLEHFALCVLRDEEPAVSNADARSAVAVAEAIHRSLELGRPVAVV